MTSLGRRRLCQLLACAALPLQAQPTTGPPSLGVAGFLLLAQPGQLSLSDSEGRLLKRWPVTDAQGRTGSVRALLSLPSRRSVAVLLEGLAELWEISLDPAAEPLYRGLVHDYRMGEGLAEPGYLGLRRTPLARPLSQLRQLGREDWLLGQQGPDAVVVHLNVRRPIAVLPAVDIAQARLIERGGRLVLALDSAEPPRLMDIRRWQPLP